VAVDATERPRPDGTIGADFVRLCAKELPDRVVADVDTATAGRAAAAAGAAAVATTLAGYTAPTTGFEPDVALVSELAAVVDVPVIAEGRYATSAHVRAAFEAGAFAVVVGTAITDPTTLTRRLAAATPVEADDAAG
jgi:N-acylglucosamine-6-phosphate 2-epimerase